MATNFDKTKPAGTTKIRLSDEQLRSNFAAVQSAIGLNHEFPVGEATDGMHKLINFSAPIADPTPGASEGAVYISDIGASAELMWQDETGNSCQITVLGTVNGAIPSGTIMLFYQDTAPTGWTIDNTIDDKLVFVSKGSAAGGETGGGAHATGTWTQLNHGHMWYKYIDTDNDGALVRNIGYQAHSFDVAGGEIDIPVCGDADTVAGGPLYTAQGAPANTWRPAAYVVIIATKD